MQPKRGTGGLIQTGQRLTSARSNAKEPTSRTRKSGSLHLSSSLKNIQKLPPIQVNVDLLRSKKRKGDYD